MGNINNLLWLITAFLIGSFPTAYVVAKRVRKIDIRQHGSGNVGATNVFRVMGKGWGSLVLVCDVFKGWVVAAGLIHVSSAFSDLAPVLRQFVFAAAAVAGHTWTPWLKLKGGKGMATSAGALLGIFPEAVLVSLIIWGIVFLAARYVSLASMIASAAFPLVLFLFYRRIESFWTVFVVCLLLAGFLIYNHRSNISRLRQGTEHRFDFGKKKRK